MLPLSAKSRYFIPGGTQQPRNHGQWCGWVIPHGTAQGKSLCLSSPLDFFVYSNITTKDY